MLRRDMASSSSSSSSSSPCAACKFLRRKCTAECVFAPYFPPDQPQKFASVHKIFGASNITKLLNDLPPHHREDAVNSLAYEAEARLKDPVYGCVGAISVLQRQVQQLQREVAAAHAELARYTAMAASSGPPALEMGMGMPALGRSRDSQMHLLDPQLTREQLMELTRVGGPYEAGFAALGMTASLGPFTPSRTASDGASGSSGGVNMGHLSPP